MSREAHESISHDKVGRLLDILNRMAFSVDLLPTLEALLDALRELMKFDAAGIFVVDPGRRVLRARATRGYPPDLVVPQGTGVVGDVISRATPRLVGNVRNASEYVEVRPSTQSQLAVPLVSVRGVVGAISLEADVEQAFTEQDLSLVALFARQAAVTIERSMIHEQLLRQSRIDREIEIAAEIVRELTPRTMPRLPGIDVHGRSVGASSVGGDTFDLLEYPESQFGVTIADPRGKGIPAALLAVAHRATLRAFVSMELRLTSMFTRMSHLMAQTMPPGAFVTAFYGIVDAKERRIVYANAGHPAPLVLRRDGTSESLEPTGGPLGFPETGSIREAYVNLRPGDGIVMFTDGVTEAGPGPDAFFDVSGVEAAARALWNRPASVIVDGVLDAVSTHAGGSPIDDSTVVVLKFT